MSKNRCCGCFSIETGMNAIGLITTIEMVAWLSCGIWYDSILKGDWSGGDKILVWITASIKILTFIGFAVNIISKFSTGGRKFFFGTYLITMLIELALASVASFLIFRSSSDTADDAVFALTFMAIYICFVIPVRCYFTCVIYDFYKSAQDSDDYQATNRYPVSSGKSIVF